MRVSIKLGLYSSLADPAACLLWPSPELLFLALTRTLESLLGFNLRPQARSLGGRLAATLRKYGSGQLSAMCGRLPVGKGFVERFCKVGRCGHVFDLLLRGS